MVTNSATDDSIDDYIDPKCPRDLTKRKLKQENKSP